MKKKALFVLTLLFISMFCTILMADDTWVCPNCGQTATENFCGNCGTAKPEKWQCPKCGETGLEGSFCTNCGYEKLQEVEHPEIVFSFEVNEDNTATITGFITGFSSDNEDVINSFTLPDSIQGHQVSEIGTCAFLDCTSLTSIGIPNSVTTIRNNAFEGCTGLTSIEIPDSVTTIEEKAFEGCTGLTSIEIPNSVTIIEGCTFWNCTSLTSIEIPNSVTTIEWSAFFGCTSLTNIDIPDSVTTIGLKTFSGCTGLTSIEIPNSVTTIGERAFENCTSLASIDIPDSVTTIELRAFEDCTGLTSIDIPDSVTTIELGTFSGCTGLTSIDIPDSVTTIDNYAFSDCTGLTSIDIPDSVTTIGDNAFDSDITLIVEESSYAEEYAIYHEYEYFYSEEYSDSTEYEEYNPSIDWFDLSEYIGDSFDLLKAEIPFMDMSDLTMVESSPDKEKWENDTISVTGTGYDNIVRIRMDAYSEKCGIYGMVPGISHEDAEEILEGYGLIYQGSSEDGWKVYIDDDEEDGYVHYVAYEINEEGLVGSIYVAEDGCLPIDYSESS